MRNVSSAPSISATSASSRAGPSASRVRRLPATSTDTGSAGFCSGPSAIAATWPDRGPAATLELLTFRPFRHISPPFPHRKFQRSIRTMARVTVEDCVDKIPNRFDLVLLAAQRARQVSGGAELTIERDRDKNPVVALREIAEEMVKPDQLHEAVVANLQRVLVDDEDTPDEIGSLSASAEALRLTAAAPPRPSPSGGDYE